MNPGIAHEPTEPAQEQTPERSRVERRYRSTLRMLPRWYRDDRADEMTATFLAERTDRVDLEYSWPGWHETGSVAALAVRTRIAGDRGPARAQAWGQAVRLLALLGLLSYAAAVIGWHVAIAAERLVGDAGPTGPWGWLGLPGAGPDGAAIASLGFSLLAVAAFPALVLGRRGGALALGVIAVAGLAIVRLGRVVTGEDNPSVLVQADFLLLLGVPVLCLALGYHREAPAVTHVRRWLAAAGALAVLTAAVSLAMIAGWTPLGVSLAPWAAAAGIAAVLTSPALAAVRQSPGWLCALAIGGLLLTATSFQHAYYTLYLMNQPGVPAAGAMLTAILVETVVAGVASALATIAATRAMRALEAPAAPA